MKKPRRGLAPMELVMWLPILLFTAALFVNVGTMTAWRVRGEIAARDVVWRVRYPRTGNDQPRPLAHVWPEPARFEAAGGAALPGLDHPAMLDPIIHGPLPNRFVVNDVLDPNQGSLLGLSEIERQYPLLRKLGKYESGEIQHSLLDRKFQTAHIGSPNIFRRTKVIYELPQTNQRLPNEFIGVVEDILGMASFTGLNVLDRDEDVKKYYGGYVDLHPRIQPNMCTLDPQAVYDQKVEPLVDRFDERRQVRLGQISYLPRTLTQFYLTMYKNAIDRLEQQIENLGQEQQNIQNQINNIPQQRRQYQNQIKQLESQLNGNPPPTAAERTTIQSQIAEAQAQMNLLPQQQQQMEARLAEIPGEIAAAQAEIAVIEPKIDQLEAFQNQLDGIERRLKEKARKYLEAQEAAALSPF